MRKKICFFIGYYPFVKGGAEYQSKLIAESLKINYDIFFISVSNNHSSKELIISDGFKVYQLNYNLNVNKVFLYYPLAQEINEILFKEKPSIIYQRILNSFSYHLSQYSSKNGIVHYIHVADKYSLIFDKANLSTIVRKLMFRNLKYTSTRLITQNEEQTQLLSQYNIKPILQIYNMHPVPQYNFINYRENKIKDSIKKIVWIGSSRPVKRLELYIELAKSFEQESKIKFYIIGRIENNQYGNELRLKIKQTENIEYLDEQENDIVNKFLEKEAFYTINTSLSEGFSNVFIQSWLRGVPVLSLNSNPDNLFDTYNLGVFFEDNLDNLKEYLKKNIDNEEEYVKKSNESYRVSRKLFSLDTSIQKIEEIL